MTNVFDALATEWLKIRTVRTTYVLLGIVAIVVGLSALLAWFAAVTWDGLAPANKDRIALAPLAGLTSWVAQLCLAVLGVLVITSEYATGAIRATLTVLPRRTAVLAAKAAVVGLTGLTTGVGATMTTFVASRLIIGDRPIRGQPTGGVAGELPSLLAMGVSVMMFGLLGLGLGAIMRSALAAIPTLVALWYIVPIAVYQLPAPWADRIGSFLPGGLAGQLAGTGNENSVAGDWLPPSGALAVMIGYMLVPLAVAAVLLVRRDA